MSLSSPFRSWSPLFAKPPAWAFPIALVSALFAVIEPLASLFAAARPLVSFRDRAIGMTTVQAVDASPYAHVYVRSCALGLGVFLLALLCLSALWHWLSRPSRAHLLVEQLRAAETRAIHLLAACALLVTALRLVVDDPLNPVIVALLLVSIVGILFIAWLRGLLTRAAHAGVDAEESEVPRSWSGVLAQLLEDPSFLLAAVFLPLPALFLCWLVTGSPLDLRGFAPGGWMGLWALSIAGLASAFALCIARRGWEPAPSMRRLLLAGVPWMLIPACIPLANEIQAGWREVSPRSLALGAGLSLLLASVGVFLVQPTMARRRGRSAEDGPGLRSLVMSFYLPLVVATMALFRVHIHSRHYDALDYFHFGEVLLPNQQFFHFGKLPLVDLRLSHTFSDMFFESLYSALVGLHGLDPVLWRLWMPVVLAAVLLYFVTARVASPGFALLVLLLLPTPFSPHYAPALLVPLSLARALDRSTWGRWIMVWGALFLVGLWRIDFGLASAVALGVVLVPWWLRGDSGSGLRQRVGASLGALAITFGTVSVGLVTLALVAGRPVFATLGMLVRSYSFRLATRTRPEIIRSFELDAVLQYYVFPAIGLLVLGLVLLRVVGPRRLAPRYLVAGQIAAFSLIISVRSLERHSLIEGLNPYAFLFLLVLLPFLWLDRLSPRAVTASLLLLGLASLLTLPPISIEKRHRVYLRPTHPAPVFRFVTWKPGEARFTYELGRREELIRFLGQTLEGEETFFDFTNSPLLYVLAGKRFPTWTIPNLIQTSEAIQHQVVGELEVLRTASQLPLVIFKQGSAFWDATDGVPNEIRSYRVAEWIYEHYEPLGEVGGHQLWAEKSSRLARASAQSRETITQHPLPPPEILSVRRALQLPAPEDGWLAFEAVTNDPQIILELDLRGLSLEPEAQATLLFDLRALETGGVQLYSAYGQEGFDPLDAAWVQVSAFSTRRVALPLPQRPAGLGLSPEIVRLRIDPSDYSRLEVGPVALQTTPGLVLPLEADQIEQHFDLHRLPRVWAELDPLEALTRTPTVWTAMPPSGWLVDAETPAEELIPGTELGGAHSGYLHLRARSPWLENDAGLPLSLGTRKLPGAVDLTVRYRGAEDGGSSSSMTFEVIRQPLGELQRLALPLLPGDQLAAGRLKNVRRVEEAEEPGSPPRGGAIFRATGPDPGMRGFLDLSEVPVLESKGEAFLAFDMSSSRSGSMQLFWSFGQSHFAEVRSRGLEVRRAGERRFFLISMGAKPAGARLTDVRLDPPPGTDLEIFAAYFLHRPLVYDDYLVRMSSQWQWSRWLRGEGPHILHLEATGPVEIESIALRAGD